jgi:hypothetical protein
MQTQINQRRNTEAVVAAIIAIWGVGAYFLGYTHFFESTPNQTFGLVVAGILIFLILFYFINRRFRAFAESIPLKTIAMFHIWRIFAGWAFISYSDSLPATFVDNAAYGDIVSGFLGLSVFIFRHSKLSYYVFNIIGAIDFTLAVGTGLYFALSDNPEINTITQLPLIIIPFFGVPISGFTHFLSFRKLMKMKAVRLTEPIVE